MKCRLLAAGTRLPEWVNTGFREYQKRLRAPLLLELEEIPVATAAPARIPSAPSHARAKPCWRDLVQGLCRCIGGRGRFHEHREAERWFAERLREGGLWRS